MRSFGRLAGATVVTALVLCATASASPQFTSSYGVKFTTKRPAASAGWSASVRLSDPGDPMKRPKILTDLKLTLPSGARLDPKGHAACRVPDQQLLQGDPQTLCPAATRYGSGRAAVIVGTSPLSFPIRSWDWDPPQPSQFKPELLLNVVLDPNNPDLSFIIDGELGRSSVRFQLPLAPQYDIHTTSIRFGVPASQRAGHTFLRTPRRCPRSGRWTGRVRASFADGSQETKTLRLPCRRA